MTELNREQRPTPKVAPVRRLQSATVPAMWEKTYHGCLQPDGTCEVWVEETSITAIGDAAVSGSTRRPVPLCLEIRDHSPTGFAWGYGGSGPAQLALAFLMDALGDTELALRHYQDFKREFVAGFTASWTISARQIRDFVARSTAT